MLVIREERESGLVRLSSFCLCLAFLSLILASALPMFVVTSFQGHGKLLIAEFDVDLQIGDGLWKRNVCYGGSRPDEQLLNQVGLTCKGQLQVAHCNEDHLSDKQEEHCDQFLLLQGMESLALFSTFIATFVGSLARSCPHWPFFRTVLRLGAIFSILIALSAASAVIRLVKESDMVDERTFSCTNVVGAELCHGWGASWGLQGAAIGELALALMLNVLLLCVSSVESTTSYQYVRVPLLQHDQQRSMIPGVVISTHPSSSQQGVIISTHSVPAQGSRTHHISAAEAL